MPKEVKCPECGSTNFITITKGMKCKECGYIIETSLFKEKK